MRSLQKRVATAWISKGALTFMATEYQRTLPNETGGVLIGYWLADSEGVVVTEAVGPGPRSKHDEISFVPDWIYQESEIARLYEKSGRMHTYLGDWHSHPDSTTRLSLTDRHTLLKVAKHADARVPTPLMAVIGQADPLVVQIWQYRPGGFIRARGKIAALQVRQFS